MNTTLFEQIFLHLHGTRRRVAFGLVSNSTNLHHNQYYSLKNNVVSTISRVGFSFQLLGTLGCLHYDQPFLGNLAIPIHVYNLTSRNPRLSQIKPIHRPLCDSDNNVGRSWQEQQQLQWQQQWLQWQQQQLQWQQQQQRWRRQQTTHRFQ